MTEQLQIDYLDVYYGVQAEIPHVHQFDESSVASTTYWGKVNMTRENVLIHKSSFYRSVNNNGTNTR